MVDSVEGAAEVLRSLQTACAPYNKLPDVQYFRFARVDHELLFRPYSLEVIGDDDCPACFYVVNSTHIIYVDATAGMTEMVGRVEEWSRQARQFDAIQRLPFFSQYIIRKALRAWLARTRSTRFRRARILLLKHKEHLAVQCEHHDV